MKIKAVLVFTVGAMVGCFEGLDPIGSPGPSQDDYNHDLPIVRALLDSNGLGGIEETEAAKIEVEGGAATYHLDLSNKGLESFHFVSATKNLKAIEYVNLANNRLTSIPEGIANKRWKEVSLHYNRLCNLSRSDSTFLANNKVILGPQECGAR